MAEELDPNKYHVIKGPQKLILGVFIILVLLTIVPVLSYYYYSYAINRPSQTDKEVTFEIRRGMSTPEISRSLYESSAINSEFLFNLYIFLNKYDRNIQAGVYVVPAGTSLVQLVDMFQSGKNDVSITFLEGWRVEEFAVEASNTYENIDYRRFVGFASDYEGYLFPDTYVFNKDVDEEEMVGFLKSTFDNKTQEVLSEENLNNAGLTKEQAVTLASIVEREARIDDERSIIAGILLKRLKEGMQLDADATVQYAVAMHRICPPANPTLKLLCTPSLEEIVELNWWPNELTQEDLEYPSSYNTRFNVGLPPKPISSVGLASIKAVVNFETTDYYYYLHGSDGVVRYARTLDEHNQNILNYLN